MGKLLDKRFVLSDNSVNRYGFRVLTEGLNLDIFNLNPIMLWCHHRDEGSKEWCDYKPIGHWEQIERNTEGQLTAKPYFDLTDELSTQICLKVEEGTIRATSIGFRPVTLSDDPKFLLPGQTRATVTCADLMEASFCDIPANPNAIRLYSQSADVNLSFDDFDNSIPLIKNASKPMKLKDSMLALLSFLGIAKEAAAETELTDEQLSSIDAEMTKLRSELSAKDTEIADLGNSHLEAVSALTAERDSLKTQLAEANETITALKAQPAPAVEITPSSDPVGVGLSELDELVRLCDEGKISYAEFTEKAVSLNLGK